MRNAATMNASAAPISVMYCRIRSPLPVRTARSVGSATTARPATTCSTPARTALSSAPGSVTISTESSRSARPRARCAPAREVRT